MVAVYLARVTRKRSTHLNQFPHTHTLFHFQPSSVRWLPAASFSFHWNENIPDDDDDGELTQNP